jgi:tetratricopeptide (TPR) repeat protein
LLAFSALAVSIGLFTSVRSDARFRAARSQFQAELTRYENDLIAGRYPIQELSRLETSTEGDRRFADEHSRALYLLREAQNGREEQESSARARERLRRFLDLRDVALFQDTQLTGLDPSDSVAAVRESALAALRLFAADSPRANQWALAPFHSSLTEQDRDHVNRGCYEMLMVLAEAIAQPLPGESPAAQARQALEILDRAAILCREPTHAYHLKRAACLERAGDVDGAKRERTAADRIRPDGAFDHFLTGLEQYKHGHLAEAKRHFAAALQARANHFWAQCLLATCDLNNRHASADVAKAYLTTCVQTHPELPWLYLLRGFAWGELGSRAASASREAEAAENFAAAEADYAEALRRDPEGKFRYALLVDRGLVRFHSGKLAEAVADLEAAIALGPRQLSAYVTMAQIHRQRHQLDRAFEALDRAIALKPNIAALYRTRARWNLERPDATPAARAEALADLDRAIRFGAPNSADLAKDHAERGRVLLLDRQFQRALDACDAALRIDPKDAGVHRWRVGALLELKREREAIDACDAYLRAGRGSADLFGLRGLAKARRNDFAGAIDDYTLALGLQANAPVLHARRGWAYLVSGAPQLALRDFEEAIRLDPSSGDAYSGRGSALVTLGRWREAVADAEESLRHGESEARLHYSAARILALAAESDKKEDRSRGPTVPRKTGSHQDRAVVLLGLALERTPPGKRAAFWREVVHSDQAFTAIRRLPAYARMAGAVDPPPAH